MRMTSSARTDLQLLIAPELINLSTAVVLVPRVLPPLQCVCVCKGEREKERHSGVGGTTSVVLTVISGTATATASSAAIIIGEHHSTTIGLSSPNDHCSSTALVAFVLVPSLSLSLPAATPIDAFHHLPQLNDEYSIE